MKLIKVKNAEKTKKADGVGFDEIAKYAQNVRVNLDQIHRIIYEFWKNELDEDRKEHYKNLLEKMDYSRKVFIETAEDLKRD